MEGLGPVGGGVCKGLEDFTDLMEVAWPAVDEEQWDGVRVSRLLVHEMDVQDIEAGDLDWQSELRELVYLGLVNAPVIAIEPVIYQALHFVHGSPI